CALFTFRARREAPCVPYFSPSAKRKVDLGDHSPLTYSPLTTMLSNRFLLALLVPVFLVAAGTLGFHLLEKLPLFQSLYLTVMTLTTVGYGDVVPRTDEGRLFAMILALGGVFTFFYAATTIIRAVVSGEVVGLLGKRYMERTLAQMHDHLIVCGLGRVGRLVCEDLQPAAGYPPSRRRHP